MLECGVGGWVGKRLDHPPQPNFLGSTGIIYQLPPLPSPIQHPIPSRQAEDPEWSYKRDLDARAAAAAASGREEAAAAAAAAPPKEEICDDHQAEAAAGMRVGDRCEAAGGRRGEVAFVGKVQPLPSSLGPLNVDEGFLPMKMPDRFSSLPCRIYPLH
jgi:hypothetical protein